VKERITFNNAWGMLSSTRLIRSQNYRRLESSNIGCRIILLRIDHRKRKNTQVIDWIDWTRKQSIQSLKPEWDRTYSRWSMMYFIFQQNHYNFRPVTRRNLAIQSPLATRRNFIYLKQVYQTTSSKKSALRKLVLKSIKKASRSPSQWWQIFSQVRIMTKKITVLVIWSKIQLRI